MLNKENFIKSVYEKSKHVNLEDDFYSKMIKDSDSEIIESKAKKNFFSMKILQIVAVLLIVFGVTVFAYNEVTKSDKKINQKISDVNDDSLDYNDMDFNKYKIINTYEEYLGFSKKYDGLIEINENDFENDFVLAIIVEGESYISDMYIDNDILYVDIIRDYEKDNSSNKKIISTKISNDLKENNIKIRTLPLDSNDFVPIKELIDRNDYPSEMAVKDGYFVTEYNVENNNIYLLSEEKILDDFLEKIKNNEETKIRTIVYGNEFTRFADVRYKNGVFSIYEYYKFKDDSNRSYSLFETGDYITKDSVGENDLTECWIHKNLRPDEENGSYWGVCILSYYNKIKSN